jgi:uncharacterized membrane protein YuzA (DUF378 family)
MKALDILAMVLVIVGALNWGLVGTAHFNLVAALFGQTVLASVVYGLVGLAAVFLTARWAIVQRPVFAAAH